MPSLGADMTEGTIVEWLVAPGDVLHRGDVVAVVDTEKAAIDVECFHDGVLDKILVPQGQKVAVGTPLAVIRGAEPLTTAGAPEHPPAAAAPPRIGSPLTRKRAAEAGVDLGELIGTGPDGLVTRADVERAVDGAQREPASGAPTTTAAPRPRISPYARRLALERGIDPATLTSSSAAGVLHARDVPATAPPQAAATEPPEVVLRRVTAALMTRSKRQIPHYYLSSDIELDEPLEWLRGHNRAVPVTARVLPAAMLLRAVALALRAVPELNGHWLDDRFRPGEGVHLGVAVALREGGLVVPVIRDADALPLDELMARLRGATERARSGRLRSSEVSGATLTVTNLGELGTDSVYGVIYPPQVALVGFGAIRTRPWAIDKNLITRPVVTATLSADHRATDGAVGARLLREIDRQLHRPEEL